MKASQGEVQLYGDTFGNIFNGVLEDGTNLASYFTEGSSGIVNGNICRCLGGQIYISLDTGLILI